MPFLPRKRIVEQLKKYEEERPFTKREFTRVTRRGTGEFRKEAVGKIVTTKEYRQAITHAINEHKINRLEGPRLLNRWKKWLRQPFDTQSSHSSANPQTRKKEETVQPQDALSRMRGVAQQERIGRNNVDWRQTPADRHAQQAAAAAPRSVTPRTLTSSAGGASSLKPTGVAKAAGIVPNIDHKQKDADINQAPFSSQESQRRHASVEFSHHAAPKTLDDSRIDPYSNEQSTDQTPPVSTGEHRKQLIEKARQHQEAAEKMLVSHEHSEVTTDKVPEKQKGIQQHVPIKKIPPFLSREAREAATALSSGQIEEKKRLGARVTWWLFIFTLVILWWREIAAFTYWWGFLGTVAGFTVGLFLLPAFPFLQAFQEDWTGGAQTLALLVIGLGLFIYSFKETARFVRSLSSTTRNTRVPLP